MCFSFIRSHVFSAKREPVSCTFEQHTHTSAAIYLIDSPWMGAGKRLKTEKSPFTVSVKWRTFLIFLLARGFVFCTRTCVHTLSLSLSLLFRVTVQVITPECFSADKELPFPRHTISHTNDRQQLLKSQSAHKFAICVSLQNRYEASY